jgi:hypothetical protein
MRARHAGSVSLHTASGRRAFQGCGMASHAWNCTRQHHYHSISHACSTAIAGQVLLRRTKNNPLLIGDPGVGKTAVVEGIAQLLLSSNIPPALCGCSLVAVDVGAMVAGTQYRGAFEEKLQVRGRWGM